MFFFGDWVVRRIDPAKAQNPKGKEGNKVKASRNGGFLL